MSVVFAVHWMALPFAFFLPLRAADPLPLAAVPDEPAEGTVPVMPEVELAPLEGHPDVRSYTQASAEHAAELARQAEQAQDVETRVGLLLRAANVILSNELEPPCTGRLLHIGDDQLPVAEEEIGAALARAAALLSDAEATMSRPDGGGEAAPDRWQPWRDRLEILRAFAEGQGAFLLPADEREMRRAASRLAVFLEHENPQVTAAAGLWQAVLRSRESDASRALTLLEPALWGVARKSLPFSFYARLLRCRLLADQESYATALALLTQIEEQCDEWFSDDAEREQAVRAAALVEVQVLRSWHDHLTDPTDQRERRWCAERIETLRKQQFAEGERTVLRLNPAVPTFAAAPAAGDRKPEKPEDGG